MTSKANKATQFQDPAGTYIGGYTSAVIVTHESGAAFKLEGLIQVEVTSGTIDLEARLTADAPWISLESFAASAMKVVALPPELRVTATGDAKAWLAETRG